MPYRFRRSAPQPPEELIRAEVFGAERLEQHAESLAAAQPVRRDRTFARPLLWRVGDNAQALRRAYQVLAAAAREGQAITPAAEWLIENFHVIDEQLREIRDDLPAGFYRELPKLVTGPLAGSPRVYGIAWAFVAHTDSRLDPEGLRRFVRAYQRVDVLTIGELWALAITLRIVLVENLRRLAEATLANRQSRHDADALANELMTLGERDVNVGADALKQLERSPLPTAFAVRLIERMRDQDPASTPSILWLHQRLAVQGTDPDGVVQAELQRQSAATVTARNIITSMRLLSALDWAEFFESVSLVDGALRMDTTFATMDFASRDRYRHAIEHLSRRSKHDELTVTRRVIEQTALASAGTGSAPDTARNARRSDPGYYLIGPGRREFERQVGYRPTIVQRLFRAYIQAATPGYLGTIALCTAAVLTAPLFWAHDMGAPVTTLIMLGVLGWIPASELAIALLNRMVAAILQPRLFPRLELKEGIPPNLRTMVVVPTLLTSVHEIEQELERLEVHYLANPDGHVQFALLTDWTDAPQRSMPGDQETLALTLRGVARLNQRHSAGPDGVPRFLLLHRERRWNAAEHCWMGWERKRGKLRELNRLLRGATDTSFLLPGDAAASVASDVRYVIALDADTRMPIGTVKRLVGTIAHPLNRAIFDPTRQRVVEGYGVLQPRVSPPLPVGKASLFQQVTSGPAGIDPYAAAVSDVYQDLFGEGSYTGKGIYDVDAFECALGDRVPENALLSHDLFEGVCARTGLVTDVALFEATPSNYLAATARQHRWARGDWQLLPWIFRFRFPLVGRWKMLDNLRRTLWAPAAVLTLIVPWILPVAAPVGWTALVLAAIALPAFLPALSGLVPRARGGSKRSHLRAVGRDFTFGALQTAFGVTMLAHQACIMADAIVRTLVRLFITHRNLLEWLTAAQAEASLRTTPRRVVRAMAGGIVVAGIAATLVALLRPESWPLALPFVVLWAVSPVVAHGISIPVEIAPVKPLSTADARALRLIARRTWRFFTTFVGADDHHLPPDNYQETPSPVVAHRTSPTNIGLYLLSVAAAHDFGWLGMLDTVDRFEATLDTMRGLERLHGHLFNWYDTTDLRPLDPRYVSSVDSGNLAGALIALAGACDDLVAGPIFNREAFAGIADAAALVLETRDAGPQADTAISRQLRAAIDGIVGSREFPSTNPGEWSTRLAAVEAAVHPVTQGAAGVAGDPPSAASSEMLEWARLLQRDVASHARDLDALVPWARVAAKSGFMESLPPLRDMPGWYAKTTELLQLREASSDGANDDPAAAEIAASAQACEALLLRITSVAQRARAMVQEMDFTMLFDPVRKLFSIGYRVADHAQDPGLYDLLASEARLASFVAIAKGDVPVAHWFHLGRALRPVGRDSVLVSWSGSMFEYLMPSLVMHAPDGSLLDQTCRLVVQRQIAYGAELGVPWGISESGYNVRDAAMTYQYSTFGVPGLGLRRQSGEDLVIAPYATGLVALVDPSVAAANFRRLAAEGARGSLGFYEALDFTPERIPAGRRVAVVRSYMAHHQGMLMLGLGEALLQRPMRRRFHAEPMVCASELLLQERTPRDVPVARPHAEDTPSFRDVREIVAPVARRFDTPHGEVPHSHLLSNAQYSVMVTAAGSGYSRWRDIAVTRWREDGTRDNAGTWIFLRDISTDAAWSAGFQPSGMEPESYSAVFSEDRAEYLRRDGPVATRLEVLVSPEDDAEVRRVSLTNLSLRSRDIDVTSYAEVVLAPQGADVVHPAFSDLFVRTECLPEQATLLATRRPRSAAEAEVWLGHVVAVDGECIGPLQWETDRERFIGRNRTIRDAVAAATDRPLSGSAGSVLHPIVALRQRIRLRPGGTAQLVFSTLVAPTRERVVQLADKYRHVAAFERAADLAWTQAQVQLRHLGVTPEEAQVFQELAGAMLYPDRTLRASPATLAGPSGGQPALWAHGISGDLPIVVLQVGEVDDVAVVQQLLRAHEYWRMKHLPVDLVVLNEHGQSYLQDLQTLLETLVRTTQPLPAQGDQATRGGIFALRADRLPAADRGALLTAARAVFVASRGTIAEQLLRAHRRHAAGPPLLPPREAPIATNTVMPRRDLQFFNGLGGFSPDGREYVVRLLGSTRTPAPWINVIANPEFGFQVSESGAGYTWSVNSQENQVTGWSNDPVTDPASEAIYIRDDETGHVWCPTAAPIREGDTPYIAHHGTGYTRFEHASDHIAAELLQFVPVSDPVKISRLTLTNQSYQRRRVSVTAYAEWVLGVTRGASAPFIVTERDDATGALLARNPWNTEFRQRVAFADLGDPHAAWTCDRAEFLGRNGDVSQPAALGQQSPLSGRTGAGFDPCAALETTVELPPRGRASLTFLLGESATRDEAVALVQRYRTADVDAVLREVIAQWDDILGTVQVTTPDPAMNLMLNRWLLYQTLACRVWARSAFYQVSGAYGFRDQLQDVMALVVARPDLSRAHLLRASARQFSDGDVQHWWHPTTGRGIRTRMSDDLLWLPYVVSHYLRITTDSGLLDQNVPFLAGARLAAGELECYFQPRIADDPGTVYEHCARAIDRSLVVGIHGLPLMGTGDWNDGMNRVGYQGRGESIWLGWFLAAVLAEWAPLAEQRGEPQRATAWRRHAGDLKVALEKEGWDGEWYRRAYFDDGTPLGSAGNDECRIDAIAQSWSVISKAADRDRSRRAMQAVEVHLVRRDDRLHLLLTPPFDKTALDPGYIKGYLPGIRENGGQYTHAAAWSIVALTALGEGDKAAALFKLLNPINHADTPEAVSRYKVEPYVVAGDVYSEAPNTGRGGWTWYTGSAGWLYRAGIESILGFALRGARLEVDPCIPRDWPGFSLVFRYRSARYEIVVDNAAGVSRGVTTVEVDGSVIPAGDGIALVDDRQTHRVRIVLGPTA